MLFYNQQICDSVNLVETEADAKMKPLTDSTIPTTDHPYTNASEGPN